MQKGPEFFVDAATQVIRKTDHIRFVMAGSGDMMDKMIQLVADRGIADKFHFTGFLRGKQVYEMLKSSDVYVMPSVSEPFGISPLEAMQCNVPSIISYQSGCSEILHNVIKTDYWDVDSMADAIYSICTYPAMAEHLKVEGKRSTTSMEMPGSRSGRYMTVSFMIHTNNINRMKISAYFGTPTLRLKGTASSILVTITTTMMISPMKRFCNR